MRPGRQDGADKVVRIVHEPGEIRPDSECFGRDTAPSREEGE